MNQKNNEEIEAMIDRLAENAQQALEKYMELSQEQVDKIVHAMAVSGLEKQTELAQLAVEETGKGVFEDKIIKNIFSTEYIWHNIKDEKTVGIIYENEQEGYIDIAEPVGVVAGVTPVTNPTSTTMFKSLISAKGRNPIIFGFHPSAQKSSVAAAKTLYKAALEAGAPEHCIQWIPEPSVAATNALMHHKAVSVILATGGSAMVRAAYSAGKPALGVGPGNVPCYIEKSADLEQACTDIMLSKTFDNGMICASEQAVIVDRELAKDFESFMAKNGCVFLDEEQTKKVSDLLFSPEREGINPKAVGMSAAFIAQMAGVEVPKDTKILIAPIKGVGEQWPLSREKLSPVLAYLISDDRKQGIELCRSMLELGGMGHSAAIHTSDKEFAELFGKKMQVGRVLVNSPCAQGAIGDIYNANTPSLTLGCGSYGRNSTTANVSTVHLINRKRIDSRRVNMQWFKVPPKVYFERGAVQYLEKMEGIERAFIVTDRTMAQIGYVDRATYYLRKRKQYCHSKIYSAVMPDPDVETIMDGVEQMREFNPDVIIAIGGGSVIDAAKGMWLFYEHPESSFDGMRLKFMDIRKRAVKFPRLGQKAKLVAIPTTSGTGSEVTSFTVITDRRNGNIKYPLADYALLPDVAIIDPQFTDSLPRQVVADTGLDTLTHAVEAYISVLASDYTDALASSAVELVFGYLEESYLTGSPISREKIHNASCIAGMAFSNAFLGLNHSMAHKLGGEFGIPHGRANALLLPYVLYYNAQRPTKFSTFPKYNRHVAHEKIAHLAQIIGVGGKTAEEGVNNFIIAVRNLADRMGIPNSIAECGISEQRFFDALDSLSVRAHEDQCTNANPRYPLIDEIKEIYTRAYHGDFPVYRS